MALNLWVEFVRPGCKGHINEMFLLNDQECDRFRPELLNVRNASANHFLFGKITICCYRFSPRSSSTKLRLVFLIISEQLPRADSMHPAIVVLLWDVRFSKDEFIRNLSPQSVVSGPSKTMVTNSWLWYYSLDTNSRAVQIIRPIISNISRTRVECSQISVKIPKKRCQIRVFNYVRRYGRFVHYVPFVC